MITKSELRKELQKMGIQIIEGQYVTRSDLKRYFEKSKTGLSNVMERLILRNVKGKKPLDKNKA